MYWFNIDKQAASFQKYICDRDRAIWLSQNNSSCDENVFPKMKPQVVSYRRCKEFHSENFWDSLRHELNVQGQFPYQNGLDAFSTICTDIFDNHAPKKSDIYDLTISLSLIIKFLRQSWQEVG